MDSTQKPLQDDQQNLGSQNSGSHPRRSPRNRQGHTAPSTTPGCLEYVPCKNPIPLRSSVESPPQEPPHHVESRKPPPQRVENITPEATAMANEGTIPTGHRIHARLPPLSPNGENFPSWRQSLSDMALIQGMENMLNPTFITPVETSPLYATQRRSSAIIQMEISNSLLPAFAATADLDLDASPLQMTQKITDHFAKSTTTTHILLRQEVENTNITQNITMDE